jgi:tripartite-type tricarboxylate transporter receptor subunit TctC
VKLPHRRQFLHLAAGAATLPVVSPVARAQAYPTRPVKWIVGAPPGGGADTVARVLRSWLSERLGQPVIIENRPGGSQNIAVQAVVRSPPDGYTVLYLGASAVASGVLFDNLPFNLLRDIVPVAGLVDFPMVLVAHPSLTARSVAELIAQAKANPGTINMASFGTGSASHIAGELFKMMAGVNLVHVPYRGSAPLVTDLVAGQVQIAFDLMPTSLPQIQAGRLRALAVTGKTRFAELPDVPRINDTVAGYDADTWAGFGVPRGSPPAIIDRLNREINAALSDPGIAARLREIGTVPKIMSAHAFAAFAAAEQEKYAKVIKFANIKPE